MKELWVAALENGGYSKGWGMGTRTRTRLLPGSVSCVAVGGRRTARISRATARRANEWCNWLVQSSVTTVLVVRASRIEAAVGRRVGSSRSIPLHSAATWALVVSRETRRPSVVPRSTMESTIGPRTPRKCAYLSWSGTTPAMVCRWPSRRFRCRFPVCMRRTRRRRNSVSRSAPRGLPHLCTNQPVSRVRPMILHKLLSWRRRGRAG